MDLYTRTLTAHELWALGYALDVAAREIEKHGWPAESIAWTYALKARLLDGVPEGLEMPL